MDDIVRQAMSKWPNVPAVYGWLGLDRRGRWLIKGERISNPLIIEFINRNYEHDAEGRWYLQNGPQRVYVALDYTPFVYRLGQAPDRDAAARIISHTGRTVDHVGSAWIDDAGVVLLAADDGFGMVDDRDLDRLLSSFTGKDDAALAEDEIAAAIDHIQGGGDGGLFFRYRAGTVPVFPIKAADVPSRFGFVKQPRQPADREIGAQLG